MRDTISSELMTDVHRIEYDCKNRTGRVFMAPGCCVDMTGTIRLFKRIALDVRVIETFAGDQPDTSYHRTSTEQWRAIDAPIPGTPDRGRKRAVRLRGE